MNGLTYEDFILTQSREEEEKLRKKLETYENMRKEVLKELHKYNLDFYDKNDLIKNSIDILNKVGENNENKRYGD